MSPAENALSWSRWAASGPAPVITQVLDRLEASPPDGWRVLKRVLDVDERGRFVPLMNGKAHWYALDASDSHAAVVLGIERPRESELRGGRVWFEGPPYHAGQLAVPTAWDEVNQFLVNGIIPAATAAGARIQVPTAEEAFLLDLPVEIRERLQAFSDSSRKILPLNREEAETWHEFVVAAFRSKVIIDSQSFIDRLVASGWSNQSAAELFLRFSDHCLLLSRYVDEVSAA